VIAGRRRLRPRSITGKLNVAVVDSGANFSRLSAYGRCANSASDRGSLGNTRRGGCCQFSRRENTCVFEDGIQFKAELLHAHPRRHHCLARWNSAHRRGKDHWGRSAAPAARGSQDDGGRVRLAQPRSSKDRQAMAGLPFARCQERFDEARLAPHHCKACPICWSRSGVKEGIKEKRFRDFSIGGSKAFLHFHVDPAGDVCRSSRGRRIPSVFR